MSPRDALASTLGIDLAELIDYEYQPGRYVGKVYTIGEFYYCARRHPVVIDGINWEKHEDQFFAERAKTVVWKGTSS